MFNGIDYLSVKLIKRIIHRYFAMSKTDKPKTVAVTVPQKLQKSDLPGKLYVTFTDDEHKRIVMNAFAGYQKTAIAREWAEFWIPHVIEKFREAQAEGADSITFELSYESE